MEKFDEYKLISNSNLDWKNFNERYQKYVRGGDHIEFYLKNWDKVFFQVGSEFNSIEYAIKNKLLKNRSDLSPLGHFLLHSKKADLTDMASKEEDTSNIPDILLNEFAKKSNDSNFAIELFKNVYFGITSIAASLNNKTPKGLLTEWILSGYKRYSYSLFSWKFYSRSTGVEFRNELEAFIHWVNNYKENKCLGIPIFSEEFYRNKYVDLLDCNDYISHFLFFGQYEGRSPNLLLIEYERFTEILNKCTIFNNYFDASEIGGGVVKGAKNFFINNFKINPSRELCFNFLLAIIRNVNLTSVNLKAEELGSLLTMINFKQTDNLFSVNNSSKFIEGFDGLIIDKTNILFERRLVEVGLGEEFDSDLKAFLAWVESIRRGEKVSPSRFIDLNYYRDSNKDLNPGYINLLTHYVLHGQYEGRSPNKLLKVDWVCSNYNVNFSHGLVNICAAMSMNGPFKSAPSFSFPTFFESNGKEKNRSFYGVIGELFSDNFNIFDSDPEILRSINRISEIEPQIKKIDLDRSYSMMPFNVDSYSYLIKLRKLIGSADVLIFRDGINYGGADVVLKFLYKFMKTNNADNVVKIISIGSVDLGVLLKHGIDKNDVVELENLNIPQYLYDDMIFDIVIGSQAKKVYNLNCGPLWGAIKTYGKIFRTKFQLYGFMFCDDRDKLGNVDGYPSRYLATAINYLDQIYLDSLYLLENIKNRTIFTSEIEKKFVVFNTPVSSFESKSKDF